MIFKMPLVKFKEIPLITKVEINDNDALIIVDLQNDFMPKGVLPVTEGDEIISPINNLTKQFHKRDNIIVMTQDWHPPKHLSFASSHKKKPYDLFEAEGIGPVLWPDHCIQGTKGAAFHSKVATQFTKAIIRKGYHKNVDSYSAFIENDKKTPTGLSGYLTSLNKRRIFLCGLALDYCVYYSAIDGRNLGFEVIIITDLSKGIDQPPGHLTSTLNHMKQQAVKFTDSKNILV